ncbi:hypothetical protein ADICYQ_5452 [Cyclobacterium qasimii M12-11B]|uniref:Uncharacterized protein n=1 Tax=Cyclobacterium qasimii M12-11B TaxID=641524 RepID=S7V6G2_9BACT|nr:hypothetical protein ADICYQ_5452 [Cyclobacterium qasimii M12-11B]
MIQVKFPSSIDYLNAKHTILNDCKFFNYSRVYRMISFGEFKTNEILMVIGQK